MDFISKHNSMYLHGKTNSGKTSRVINYLKNKDYEYQYCSIQNIKNESYFFDLLKNQNIFNMMKMKKIQRVIVIDNIDYLQNNDKKVLSIIAKYMKKKNKTNAQNDVKYIFIGINEQDKKVTELEAQVEYIHYIETQVSYTEADKNVKEICKELLINKNVDYFKICEKTIVSLMYHENILFYANKDLLFYEQFLESFVNGDYYDRVSFQRQLWQFNEMTFFLKVINNYINLHNRLWENEYNSEIIFTKILTKYSNEYSNQNFIINICTKLNLQKIELIEQLKKDICQVKLLDNEKKRLFKLLF